MDTAESANQILEILTKKKYSRNEPHRRDDLIALIEKSVTRQQPIQLVGFWGTGPKDIADEAEAKTCKFLDKLHKDVQEIFAPGIEYTFILATMHGLHNGCRKNDIDSYLQSLLTIFSQYGFKHVYLHDLWEKYGLSFEKIDAQLAQKEPGWWSKIENRALIEESAKKRNRRLDPQSAAKRYYIMRTLEKNMLETEFKGYIFHAFTSPDMKNVLPDIPTLYLYARQGRAEPPWLASEKPLLC